MPEPRSADAELIALLPLGAHILELAGEDPEVLVLRAANRAASDQAGFDLRPHIGRPVAEVHPAGSDLVGRLADHARRQAPLADEVPFVSAGAEGCHRLWVRPIGGGRILVLYDDITDQRRNERRLRHSELINRSIVAHLAEGVVVVDDRGVVQLVNPAVSELCRADASSMVGRPVTELPIAALYDRDGRELELEDSPALRALGGDTTRGRLAELVRLDGSRAWVELGATPLLEAGDLRPRGAVSTYADVTDRVERERRARHEADHDPLTGLANRRMLDRALEATVARAGETGQHVAVLLIDLDAFKAVNDRYGHGGGDQLLREVAARLGHAVRERDLVARVGGDEFVVLLPDVAGEPDAAEIVRRRVQEAFAQPFELGDAEVPLGATVGLASSPEQGTTPRALLEAADREMYARKRP